MNRSSLSLTMAATMAATAMAVVLGLAGAATAQDSDQADAQNRRVQRFMEVYDTNGDGVVTEQEIEDEQMRIFTAADVDGDGKLSVEEFRRRGRLIMRTGGATLFDMLDHDGDANVSVEEFRAPKARWLKRYDTDGTPGLSAEELSAALPNRGHGRR